jgi:uncharacterized membrane protein
MHSDLASLPLISNPIFVTLLASVALGIAIWFFVHGLGARGLPGCGPESGCDAVTRSRWSRCGRVPVAAFGATLYLGTCIASLLAGYAQSSLLQRAGWLVLIASLPMLAGGAIWFIAIQVLLIQRICRWCMLAHALALFISVCVVYAANQAHLFEESIVRQPWLLLVPGTLALMLLIAVQTIVEPRTYAVTRVAGPPPVRPPLSPEKDIRAFQEPQVVRHPPAELTPNPFAGRTVTAAEGRIVVPGDVWPVLGSPKATHLLLYLFDYTCKECRYVHSLLDEVMQRHPLQLAVMVVPVPRDPLCNPTVKTRATEHAFACAYTRLGLAVWRANWSKYAEFDRYMFKSPHVPSLGQARVKAVDLVGSSIPNPELPHLEIDARIVEAVQLFQSAGTNIAPTLLLPQRAVAGRPPTADHLYKILEHYLKLEGG